MIRIFDLIISILALFVLSPLLLIMVIIGFFDTGSPIFIQERMGKNKKPFLLIKFRTMTIETKSVASHLADSAAITNFGRFLRKSKIDELPQLINVITGDMSLVGPRPNLFNQNELIEIRQKYGVYKVRPGVTGLAQVSEIDMSTPELLAKTDAKMVATMSIANYFKYILMTASGRGQGDRVKP